MSRWPPLLAIVLVACRASPTPVEPVRIADFEDTIFLELEDVVGLPWEAANHEPGHSGRGYIVPPEGEHDPLEMSLPIERPGTYQFWVRAFQGGNADRRFHVRVDGADMKTTHDDPKTPGFYWRAVGRATIEARATIAIVDGGVGHEMIDAIALSSDPSYDPVKSEHRFRVFAEPRSSTFVLEDILARAQQLEEQRSTIATREDWAVQRDELRTKLLERVGLSPLPERTPLNARVLETNEGDGYTIERLVFESRPDLYVTANVLVPDGDGPFPAVVRPIGHWGPRTAPTPLAVSIGLARQGYLVLTYDAFGQGERANAGNSHGEHYHLLLSGHTNLSIMVWDSVRAIDYLMTRSDVDASAIGITGASGGGLNALYTAAIDDRITAAIPAAYVTEWYEFLATGLSHDECNHVPGIAALAGMGRIAGLFAPRPMAIFSGELDPAFTPEGAARAYRDARSIYDLYGTEDVIRHEVFEGGHDYSAAMRQSAYDFFGEHLRGPMGPEVPFDVPAPDDERFVVFPDGNPASQQTTARELARDWAVEAIDALDEPVVDDEPLRRRLRDQFGVGAIDAEATLVDEVTVEGFTVERLVVTTATTTTPVLFVRVDPEAPTVLIADAALHTEAHPLLEVARRGFNAIYVSPIGMGETHRYEHDAVTTSLLIGAPIAVRRAHDLEAARGAIATYAGLDDIRLVAVGGSPAWSALLAQALWGNFSAAAIGPIPATLLDTFQQRFPRSLFVPGILRIADVPHLVALALKRRLRIAVTMKTRPLPESLRTTLGEDQTSWIDLGEALSWMAADGR